ASATRSLNVVRLRDLKRIRPTDRQIACGNIFIETALPSGGNSDIVRGKISNFLFVCIVEGSLEYKLFDSARKTVADSAINSNYNPRIQFGPPTLNIKQTDLLQRLQFHP